MRILVNALVCALAGAIGAHIAYVQSNLFLHGDSTRRGRHILYDPLAFDGLGLLWGVLAGIFGAAWWFAESPAKAAAAGLAVTLAGVGVVGALTTYQRYQALPRTPVLAGPALELDFELRLPADPLAQTRLPVRGALNPASKDGTLVKLQTRDASVRDGRVILPGHVPLRHAETPHLISIETHEGTFHNFLLPLAEVPTDADRAWTDWINASNTPENQPPAQVAQLRYRVRLASER